jgi:hypothetical protein
VELEEGTSPGASDGAQSLSREGGGGSPAGRKNRGGKSLVGGPLDTMPVDAV